MNVKLFNVCNPGYLVSNTRLKDKPPSGVLDLLEGIHSYEDL
jgi:hypothetical protein